MKLLNRLQLLKTVFLAPILALFLVTSCQDEVIEVTLPDNQEIITANSNLSNLMSSVSSLNGTADNIIDNASCLTIALPVTVQINGVEFILNTADDYDAIEAIFDEFDDDNDSLDIQFPITIIFSDYSEIEITNQTDLDTFVDECLDDADFNNEIECIDFQYPIVFSVYNSNFQITETVTIQNDEGLYNFIEALDGGILASLNFPVTLILSDGSTLQVNSNVELEAAIDAAENTCEDTDDNGNNDCDIQSITANIVECVWNATSFSGNSDLSPYSFNFLADGAVLVSGNGALDEGYWELVENTTGMYLVIGNLLGNDLQGINGDWLIVDCDDDALELVKNQETLVLDRDCNSNQFSCFGSFNEVLTACDDDSDGINDGFAVFYLDGAYANCNPNGAFFISYHVTLIDAESATNALQSPYTNVSSPEIVYVRVEIAGTPNQFEIFELELIIENCSPSTCSEIELINSLQECDWNIVNFNGSNDFINYDLEFQVNNTLVITGNGQTITGTYAVTQDTNGMYVEFIGVNGANIQAITGMWSITDCDPERLEMAMGTDTMVMERDCN